MVSSLGCSGGGGWFRVSSLRRPDRSSSKSDTSSSDVSQPQGGRFLSSGAGGGVAVLRDVMSDFTSSVGVSQPDGSGFLIRTGDGVIRPEGSEEISDSDFPSEVWISSTGRVDGVGTGLAEMERQKSVQVTSVRSGSSWTLGVTCVATSSV